MQVLSHHVANNGPLSDLKSQGSFHVSQFSQHCFSPIKAVMVWGGYSRRVLVGMNQLFAHCLHIVRRRSQHRVFLMKPNTAYGPVSSSLPRPQVAAGSENTYEAI